MRVVVNDILLSYYDDPLKKKEKHLSFCLERIGREAIVYTFSYFSYTSILDYRKVM